MTDPWSLDDVLDPPVVRCDLCQDDLLRGEERICWRCEASIAAEVADE